MNPTEDYRVRFMGAYRAALLWQATDEAGEPLDREYSDDDFSGAASASIDDDCQDFINGNFVDLLSVGSPEQHGHDFALTRNHHGAGFWDRGYGEVGERLTEASHPYGASDVYVSDDGKLEVS